MGPIWGPIWGPYGGPYGTASPGSCKHQLVLSGGWGPAIWPAIWSAIWPAWPYGRPYGWLAKVTALRTNPKVTAPRSKKHAGCLTGVRRPVNSTIFLHCLTGVRQCRQRHFIVNAVLPHMSESCHDIFFTGVVRTTMDQTVRSRAHAKPITLGFAEQLPS